MRRVLQLLPLQKSSTYSRPLVPLGFIIGRFLLEEDKAFMVGQKCTKSTN